MRAVLSLLTRIPVGAQDLKGAAKQQLLFPVVGALIGIIAYLPALALFTVLPAAVAALLTLLAIYLLTGLLHLDGLGDFSDGLMAPGDRRRKNAVMKDPRIGTAGVFSILIIILIEFCCLMELGASLETGAILFITFPHWSLTVALITSEVSAKLAMNTCIFFGKKAHAGMGSIFIERASTRRYFAAFASAATICLAMAGLRGLIFIAGILAGALVAMAANRTFGGVSGDALGMANEITRAATLLLWVVIL